MRPSSAAYNNLWTHFYAKDFKGCDTYMCFWVEVFPGPKMNAQTPKRPVNVLAETEPGLLVDFYPVLGTWHIYSILQAKKVVKYIQVFYFPSDDNKRKLFRMGFAVLLHVP